MFCDQQNATASSVLFITASLSAATSTTQFSLDGAQQTT
jgi:hypothetical protein